MDHPSLPELPLGAWEETKRTLHLYAQIVGKVRMALHPKLNHWWHVTLYPSARGLSTRAIPLQNGRLLELEFDFLAHALRLSSSDGKQEAFALADGLSVAGFYRALRASLGRLEVAAPILAQPYDAPKVGSALPFAEDETHARYDAPYVARFHRALAWTTGVFTAFSGRFAGKSTPVQLFWHSFDLVYTRFSGRAAPLGSGSASDREAYSHEVVSFGFWPGDASFPDAAFYSYTYPQPAGLQEARLAPPAAFWTGGGALALLPYAELRLTDDPRGALLDFLQRAYEAGAERAGWDAAALAHASGEV